MRGEQDGLLGIAEPAFRRRGQEPRQLAQAGHPVRFESNDMPEVFDGVRPLAAECIGVPDVVVRVPVLGTDSQRIEEMR
jgi:hypothetical protein